MNYDDFLKHFGIPGMHWGRRSGKSKKSKPSHTHVENHSVSGTVKSKKIHELSNTDIKKITERLTLEKQYKELTKAQISPGKKFVMGLLQTAATEYANAFIKKQITKMTEGKKP